MSWDHILYKRSSLIFQVQLLRCNYWWTFLKDPFLLGVMNRLKFWMYQFQHTTQRPSSVSFTSRRKENIMSIQLMSAEIRSSFQREHNYLFCLLEPLSPSPRNKAWQTFFARAVTVRFITIFRLRIFLMRICSTGVRFSGNWKTNNSILKLSRSSEEEIIINQLYGVSPCFMMTIALLWSFSSKVNVTALLESNRWTYLSSNTILTTQAESISLLMRASPPSESRSSDKITANFCSRSFLKVSSSTQKFNLP